MATVANYFLLMMLLGTLWGVIQTWNAKIAFGAFMLLVLWIIVAFLFTSTGSEPVDIVRLFIGVLGFGMGYIGGKNAYKQTFEDDNPLRQ